MAIFIHTKQQEIDISPNELAELFWSMDSGEQASFFNHLGVICDDSFRRQSQLLMVMEESTPEAREVMNDFGWAANEVHFNE